VEFSVFDRPLARGRVAFGDGFAVPGPVLPVKEAQVAPEHEAMVLAAAEQACSEGAATLRAGAGGRCAAVRAPRFARRGPLAL